MATIAALCRGPLFIARTDLVYQWATSWYAEMLNAANPDVLVNRSMRDFLPADFCDEWARFLELALHSSEPFSVCHMFAGARTFANVYPLQNAPEPSVFVALTVEDPLATKARDRREAQLPPNHRIIFARQVHLGMLQCLRRVEIDVMRQLAHGRDLHQASMQLELPTDKVRTAADCAQLRLRLDSLEELAIFAFEKGLHLYEDLEWLRITQMLDSVGSAPKPPKP